jgi:hypothetical protein
MEDIWGFPGGGDVDVGIVDNDATWKMLNYEAKCVSSLELPG